MVPTDMQRLLIILMLNYKHIKMFAVHKYISFFFEVTLFRVVMKSNVPSSTWQLVLHKLIIFRSGVLLPFHNVSHSSISHIHINNINKYEKC